MISLLKEFEKEIEKSIEFNYLKETEHYLNRDIDNLSYGIKRKILFARSLVHNPSVLLLDEPTIGMDPNSRIKIWNVLDKLCKTKTIII